jgi:hypothetical protein
MGNLPTERLEKTAPEIRRRFFNGQLSNGCSLVRLILDGLAGVFHVFTKPMCRMAPGENNLTYNCDQETEGRSF